jgi:hypothetical protein
LKLPMAGAILLLLDPFQKGGLVVPVDANCETWPLPSDMLLLRPDGWPDLLPSVQDRVKVTIEVTLSIGNLEGHSACRSLMVISSLSVFDLLSFLCHSTVGTSIRSCVPRSFCGGVD